MRRLWVLVGKCCHIVEVLNDYWSVLKKDTHKLALKIGGSVKKERTSESLINSQFTELSI